MAENNSHSYEIIIKLDQSNGSGTSKKQNGNPKSFIAEAHSKLKNFSPIVGIAFKEGEAFVKNAIAFNVSNIGLTTGNTESQERAEFQWHCGTKLAGTTLALGTGNFAAAAMTVITEMMNIYFKDAQIKLRQSIENESLALSRQRAGIAFNSSRLKGAE